MNNVTKKRLGLLLLLSACATAVTHRAQARLHHFVFDDMFDDNMLDLTIFDDMHEQMRQLSQQMGSFGPSKEDREAVKTAREALLKIKPEVTQDDQHVIIKFNLDTLDNINKKAIDLEVKEYVKPTRTGLLKAYNILQGVIPVAQQGKIEFYITHDSLKVVRHIEIKKQNKDDNKSLVSLYGSSFAEVINLPASVEITKDAVKAQTKDSTFTITLTKKKQAAVAPKQDNKIAIAHA